MADLYVGQLAISYYLDPAAPLTGRWEAAPGGPDGASTNLTRFNPVPVAKATNFPIPLFVTVPNAASTHTKPVAGWPVVIFQHGITGNRTQAAAIAGTYASQGFVVAAIDIPLHGVTDPSNPLLPGHGASARSTSTSSTTRPARPAPDGIIDPSGTYFINLSSLLTSRDNLRQSAIDIIQLVSALPGLDLDGDASPDIDRRASTLPASRWAPSSARSRTPCRSAPCPPTSTCRAAASRTSCAIPRRSGRGSRRASRPPASRRTRTLYEQFFRDAQAAVDAGDPINYIAGSGRGAAGAAHAGDQRRGRPELRDAAAHQRRDPFVKTATPGLQPRGGRHGHLGELHRGLPRLAAVARGEPRGDHRDADACGLARGVRRHGVRDHEPGHPGTLTAAEGGFLARLAARVNRGTSWALDLVAGRRIDAELLEELETRLLEADVGVDATEAILSELRGKVARSELADAKALEAALAASLLEILAPAERPLAVDRSKKPFVILVVGVNGSGKTTTIGKLARRLKD